MKFDYLSNILPSVNICNMLIIWMNVLIWTMCFDMADKNLFLKPYNSPKRTHLAEGTLNIRNRKGPDGFSVVDNYLCWWTAPTGNPKPQC